MMNTFRAYTLTRGRCYSMDHNVKAKTEVSGFAADAELSVTQRKKQGGAPSIRRRKYRTAGKTRKKEQLFDARSMMIKCSICAAACAAVLLAKWANIPAAEGALTALKTTLSEDETAEDILGRLKFVELPGMIQVFSNSGKLQLPIAAHQFEYIEDDSILVLTAENSSTVKAGMSGVVKETGIDAVRGKYIRIRSESDADLFLYGLSDISAEVGQPLCADDDVGAVSALSKVYVAITVSGRPQNPSAFFELPTQGL